MYVLVCSCFRERDSGTYLYACVYIYIFKKRVCERVCVCVEGYTEESYWRLLIVLCSIRQKRIWARLISRFCRARTHARPIRAICFLQFCYIHIQCAHIYKFSYTVFDIHYTLYIHVGHSINGHDFMQFLLTNCETCNSLELGKSKLKIKEKS